ncbi:MAG TPA: PQQ-binding-like beta-propeller repeat protein [Planctomycetota bacterium]|nr:PQQ-binding-like beta-propeller repeat protein [Planctomycetota bacterium]
MKTFVLALCASSAASPAMAQEWTRFRGPNGSGVSESKNVPVKWGESEILWKVAIPGPSHSQPVIWGERLFLCGAKDDGRERSIHCLRKDDGRELWSRKLPSQTHGKHKLNSFASSSPTVDAERVYAAFVDPEHFVVKAWDHAGKELWSVDLGPFKSQHGHGASPILHDDKLIVTNDQDGASFVAALDAKTGRMAWKSPRRNTDQSTAYSTPILLERPGAAPELLTSSGVHGLSSLDPRTGRVNWEARVFDKRAVSSPVLAGNLVVGTCGQGGSGTLYAVKLGGRGDVTSSHLAYQVKTAAPYVPTPVALGDRLFLVSDKGVASCVEAGTGRVIWSERIGGEYYCSPVLAEGRVYVNSTAGETVVFQASESFSLLARNPLGEGSHTAPVIDGGRLYLKTFNHLLCVGTP